ncbi:hypothetical protein QMK38_13240 [Lysinibacillus fusiformis]|nr:hypothetical protein [Lysinibacillus fusiformis]
MINLILNGLPVCKMHADSLLPESEYYLLNGISAKVLHPIQLLNKKEVYERIGRSYRKKNEESKKILYRAKS